MISIPQTNAGTSSKPQDMRPIKGSMLQPGYPFWRRPPWLSLLMDVAGDIPSARNASFFLDR